MKRIVAGQNDAGQRLDKFLIKLLKSAPKGMIYKWIRKKRVKINGKKSNIDSFINEGDVIELYINDEFFDDKKDIPAYLTRKPQLSLVYEDENILISDKPSGMVAHDGDDSLICRVQAYLYQKSEYDPKNEKTFAPALCNRIDRNTSGLVIAAKNAEALRIINEKIRNREIDKFYILKTEGVILQSEGKIEGYTIKNEKENKVYFYKENIAGSKKCVTEYRTLDKEGTVEAKLITGRTHQIRASFAAIGHPLVGDVKYGAKKDGKSSFQNLRAYKLVFSFNTPAGKLEYLSGKVFEVI